MLLSNFVPNFKEKRTIARTQNVLNWVNLHLHEGRATNVHSSTLRQVFGPTGNKLANYLRANLLIQSGQYMVGTSSYSYTLRKEGFEKIQSMLEVTEKPQVEFKSHKDLETMKFNYTDKSDRLWHPLQNLKREKKAAFWEAWGLPYDYDIEACAPTVLVQLATRFGMLPLLAQPIVDYLANKDAVRQHVADLTGCSLPTAKRLINSLFNGARLAKNNYCSAFKALDYDEKKMDALQNDPTIKSLRAATKNMWAAIQRHTDYDLKKSKAKWSVYFKFERAFLNIISMYCDENDIILFTEHDGFRTNKMIDKEELIRRIDEKTGFKLKISGPLSGN